MAVNPGVWTCPYCTETVRGTAKARRAAQRAHARRHGNAPRSLTIPPVPRAPQRRR